MMRLFICAALFFGVALAAAGDHGPVPRAWRNDGRGEVHLLYRGKSIEPLNQGRSAACVGCAAAKALEIMHGKTFSAEWIYAASREKGDGIGPGSYCGWAAAAATDIGVLPSGVYPFTGHDLRKFDPGRANSWIRGPPEELKAVASLYRSEGRYEVHDWADLRGAISRGYPVIIGSSVRFGPKRGQVRSSTGELRARILGSWRHAMVVIACDDRGSGAALVLNSWGDDWVSGPQRFGDEPKGSFWASRWAIECMLSSKSDGYVILPIRGLE